MTPFKTIKPSTLDRDAFVAAFADVYEHSPWVADTVYQAGVDATLDDVEVLHTRLSQAMLAADRDTQLALVNAHPDLAGKAAVRGELTASSTSEQAGAGIHECTPEEFARFSELNEAYKARFGFPFIMAVKGSNRHQILAALEERMHNSPEQEFARALAEINTIALFRLQAM
ncbi:2-oxo-4-hydroxy-4-carboxy-5-ureidoimidazoline decarboxylase [Stutzerimonas stutzeri]|uniref:2-oxo-4-hydroxy-4-carboxy-5-ureidoimidazoline decarboxylase n=1 Tax=Stutzerimonas stutzeri TaxID=316 RepID=UPI00210D1893|nr:2-oxo-4-hydroxy-4-carboxy-5-ureidoimidazoline decarboxylase [Stutzerimonas stutzeri]MCQ4319691.1 2-oxo-4-hydroxy-4-carboxy-5-ureidoimidazoline decarboxylase [Stutzerimonas stutzeri]